MRRGDDADPGLGASDIDAKTEVARVAVHCAQPPLAPLPGRPDKYGATCAAPCSRVLPTGASMIGYLTRSERMPPSPGLGGPVHVTGPVVGGLSSRQSTAGDLELA